jgi:hypothetical protein
VCEVKGLWTRNKKVNCTARLLTHTIVKTYAVVYVYFDRFRLRPLYPRGKILVPRILGGSGPVWRWWPREKSLPISEIEHRSSSSKPVTSLLMSVPYWYIEQLHAGANSAVVSVYCFLKRKMSPAAETTAAIDDALLHFQWHRKLKWTNFFILLPHAF